MAVATTAPLPAVLGAAGRRGLPLHINRSVRAAAGQGNDVIDHIARARPPVLARAGARVPALELCTGCG